MTIKNSAPPSYDEVFGNISKDEPPQYQDIVHEEWMHGIFYSFLSIQPRTQPDCTI